MILGGGFLGQMSETLKKNRDMLRAALGKTKRKPFDNGEYIIRNTPLKDNSKRLTKEEKHTLISKVKAEEKKEARKNIIILILSILTLPLIFVALQFILSRLL